MRDSLDATNRDSLNGGDNAGLESAGQMAEAFWGSFFVSLEGDVLGFVLGSNNRKGF